ncbi:MAG: tRNA 2-thiouridine(34) synthase MnmA [Rickettsiales bacterium]|nr:tRNA 2-thiouridine(34) synthase MnmA [Rickettsiales bacterium]
MDRKRKIVVAMSGGVDSSTAAAILKEQGHEVIGVTLKLCAFAKLDDAQKVAEQLKIKHHVLDLRKEFHKNVISYSVDLYTAGETPNPCVKCNEKMKFGMLYDFAKKLGADSLATGHYIRKVVKNNKVELHKAVDHSKDQSYFLVMLKKDKLSFLEFPLGGYQKPEVRELARKYNLIVADKQESNDLTACFTPDGDYSAVINKNAKQPILPGNIVDMQGNVVGKHNGITNYTIGQRRGIGVSLGKPVYVIKIDAKNNSIVVGDEEDLEKHEFYIRNTNWFVDPKLIEEKPLSIKVRSTHKGSEGRVYYCLTRAKYICRITTPVQNKAIAPGQACVIYSDTHMLGGGIICSDHVK